MNIYQYLKGIQCSAKLTWFLPLWSLYSTCYWANNYINKSIVTNWVKPYDRSFMVLWGCYYRRTRPTLGGGWGKGKEGVSEELTCGLRAEERVKVNQTWWGWGEHFRQGIAWTKAVPSDETIQVRDGECAWVQRVSRRVPPEAGVLGRGQTLQHLAGHVK